MKMILLILQFTSAIALIAAILMHSPKGEGLGGIGGSAKMFHAQKGMESGLNRVTSILATVFLVSAGIFGVFY